jgi:hypothetical protein
MKLFASSQDANSNAAQDTIIELGEQELNAISGGCGCGQQEAGFPVFPGGEGYNFGCGESFNFGEGFGFGYRQTRHCEPRPRHCCRY